MVTQPDGTYRLVDQNPPSLWSRLLKAGRVLDPTAPTVPTNHNPVGFGKAIRQNDMEIKDSPVKQAATGLAQTANMVPIVGTVTQPFTQALDINSQPSSTSPPQPITIQTGGTSGSSGKSK